MTIAEFCTANNKPRSTVRARWNAARAKNPTLPAFDITREVDAQTRAIIDPTSRAKPAQKPTASRAKKTPNNAQHLRAEVQPTRAELAQFMEDFTRDIERFSQPESAQDLSAKVAQETRKNDAQDSLESVTVLIAPLLITALSVLLTICGLYIAKWAGVILGSMFAIYLFISVVMARNREKGYTSQEALATVLRLEIGAAVLHCFTFWRLLPELAGDWFLILKGAACLVLAGFVAYLSYNAVLTVRSYFSEVEEPENLPTP